MPAMTALVPPEAGPDDGVTPVTVGPATKVYWSPAAVALVPPGVVAV